MKDHVMISVERQVIEKAKENGINVSSAAEDGIISKINYQELDRADYPLENAEKFPDEYWIAHDGLCYKRGKLLFFINDFGKVREVSKQDYLLHLGVVGKGRYSSKEKSPAEKEGKVVSEGFVHEKI